MGLVKKLKDILFEEEEYTEPVKVQKVQEEVKKEEVVIPPKLEPVFEEPESLEEKKVDPVSERDLFKRENSFTFPDFDEEEFQSSFKKPKSNANVLEYERKKTIEKRTDYGRYERVETREYTEKKKFKPSPIISPVYGILNQDYKAEDIVNKKDTASNVDIEVVRRKAFEPKIELPKKEEKLEETIDEPVVTFFEEKESVKVKEKPIENDYKSIDDLLESASDVVDLEDTLEIPKTNNIDVIEEELEKLDSEVVKDKKDLDDTLDNDLYELIDSMYESREEE